MRKVYVTAEDVETARIIVLQAEYFRDQIRNLLLDCESDLFDKIEHYQRVVEEANRCSEQSVKE